MVKIIGEKGIRDCGLGKEEEKGGFSLCLCV